MAAPLVPEYFPAIHGLHTALPSPAANVPALQAWHDDGSVDEGMCPAWHRAHDVAPPDDTEPAEHGVHAVSPLVAPYDPAAHRLHRLDPLDEYDPAAQALHWLAPLDEYSPAAQGWQVDAWNGFEVPAGQTSQVVPSAEACVPAGQARQYWLPVPEV